MISNKTPSSFRRFINLLTMTIILGQVAHGNTDEVTRETEQPLPARPPAIMLQAYTIEEAPPKLCFGVSLSLWKDANTGLVTAIYIDKVKSGSDAAENGFGPRTRIYSINGNPVEDMRATFNGDSELNKIFINRKNGSKIVVEGTPEGTSEIRTVILIERINSNVKFRNQD